MIGDRGHHVGALALDLAVADLDSAFHLQARVEDLSRIHFPRVLERVLNALVPRDRIVRLERIDLDLGDIQAARLEADAPAALERALSRALGDALAAASLGAGGSVQSREAAALDDFETYLVHGIARFRPAADPFDSAENLTELITAKPAALAAMLRRHARDRHAIERLVLQADPAALRALLGLLAPADAALILTYHEGLRKLYMEASAALPEPVLRRSLWVLTFEFLLRDPGSQSNRRAFVAWLIAGLAAAEGISEADLLALLHDALERTRRRRPPTGSLPGVLDELFARRAAPAERRADDPAPGEPIEALLVQLRAAANDPAALEALVRRLSAPLFARLVARLEPEHAEAILAHVAGLAALHREAPLLALSETGFTRAVHLLVLRYLLREAGSQFNRRAWLRRLLHGLAAAGGVRYAFLLESIAAALAAVRRRLPAKGSLPAALAALVADLPREREQWPANSEAALLARLRRHAADPAALALLAQGLAPGDFRRLLTRLAPRRAAAIAAELADLRRESRAFALSETAFETQLRALALRSLFAAPDAPFRRAPFRQALRKGLAGPRAGIAPADPAALAEDLETLRRHHAVAPLVPLDAEAFRDLTETLARAASGHRFDRARMRRAMLDGLARHQGVAPAEIGHWPAEVSSEPSAPDLLAAVERYLRDGRPFGARLPQAARDHPIALAALLRRLTIAASGEPRALTERLLAWLLPEEVTALLRPDLADTLPPEAGAEAIELLLRGEDLPQIPFAHPGAAHDRPALLRHWLDTGALPWWSPPGTRIDMLLASVADRPFLLADFDPERMVQRLARAVEYLGEVPGAVLLEALAPWAFAGGEVAARAQALSASERIALRIRAAAAAVAGAPIDLGQLTRPLPAVPEKTPPPEPPRRPRRAAVLAWLGSGGTPPSEALLREIATLADRGDPALDNALRAGIVLPETRARWAAALPDEIFARLIHRIAPARAHRLLDLLAILRRAAPSSHAGPAALRTALLEALATGAPDLRIIPGRLIAALTQVPAVAETIRARAAQIAGQGGHAPLVALLRPSVPPARLSEPQRREIRPPDPDPTPGTALYIANAGLILFNPFLPRFFERLGVLTQGEDGIPRIKGIEAASRAVHLLQYLVDARLDRPEPDVLLNKLLCGLPPATPVARSIEPEPGDLALCEGLVAAVIANWPAIANTSPAGLRETFLQRDGRLRRGDDRWTLEVDRRTVDVLVDQIPWNRALVFHRWMAHPLHVNW